MPDRSDLARLPDDGLQAALVDLGRSLAWPAVPLRDETTDLAARARRAIERAGARSPRRAWWELALPRRRFGSSVVLAAAALLIIAAIAGAIGLGLPGIRITPTSSPALASAGPSAEASASPSPRIIPPATLVPTAPGPVGSFLGLGDPVDVASAATLVDFPLRLPPSSLGRPETAWLLNGRLTLVWRSSASLPPLAEPAAGLILTEFEGGIDPAYFEKFVHGGTTVETVRVGERTGYWISGEPHELIYVDRYGQPVFDSHRIVGDTLLWADGPITYRLESALGRDRAVALAESLR